MECQVKRSAAGNLPAAGNFGFDRDVVFGEGRGSFETAVDVLHLAFADRRFVGVGLFKMVHFGMVALPGHTKGTRADDLPAGE